MRFFLSCICLICLFGVIAEEVQAGKVLVIESYHSGFGWDADYLRGLSEVLLPDNEIRTFEMDTKRIPQELFAQKAHEALDMFRAYRPDIVILGDDNASRLLAADILKTNVPIVYLGLNNNPRCYGLYGHEQVAGIMERPLLMQSVHVARKIYPSPLQKILFLFDFSETSTFIAQESFHGARQRLLNNVQTDIVQVATFAEWKKVVRSAKGQGYDVVCLGLYQRLKDAHGDCTNGAVVLDWTMQNVHLPTMGLWSFSIGEGKAAAGLAHSGVSQGRAAGTLAKRMLRGERSVQIPTQVEEGVFIFSRSEVARQGFVIPDSLRKEAVILE